MQFLIIPTLYYITGEPAVAQVVDALRYMPEFRKFDFWNFGIFHSHYTSGRTVALGSTQPLIEMSTRNISWGREGGVW